MGVIAIVGPTASAKSSLAMALARRLEGEVVSVDSMQVYRGLDVGTAKPDVVDRAQVPHHLIDVADPEDTFTVAEHQKLGVAAIDEILERGAVPIVVGGSGLHFRALVDPLEFPPSDESVRAAIEELAAPDAVVELLRADPEATKSVDLANPRRVARALEVFRLTGETPTSRSQSPAATAVREYTPRLPLIAIGLDPGDGLGARIVSRFDKMLDDGLLAEVSRMHHRLGVTASQGVGYKELLPVVRNEATIDEGRAAAVQATKALAKRQRTFFRRDPRIRWISWHDEAPQMVAAAAAAVDQQMEEMAWTL